MGLKHLLILSIFFIVTFKSQKISLSEKINNYNIINPYENQNQKQIDLTKIKLEYKEFDSDIEQHVFCGKDKIVNFVLTVNKLLYITSDNGISYKTINSILLKISENQLIKSQNGIGKITKLISSNNENYLDTIYILGSDGFLWITNNCGKSFNAVNLDRQIYDLLPHYSEINWLIATTYTKCSDFEANEACKIYKEAHLSKDNGKNWDLMASYVEQIDWAMNESYNNSFPKERILLTYNQKGKGSQKINGAWNYKIDFAYSDDFFKTTKIVIHKGNKFLINNNFLYVAQIVDQEAEEIALYVDDLNSKYYDFQQIEIFNKYENDFINKTHLKENSFSFLSSKNSIVLSLTPKKFQGIFGSIYLSDDGINFYFSLNYIFHSKHFRQNDFLSVNSINGIYLTNCIDLLFIEGYKDLISDNNYEFRGNLNDSNTKLNKLISTYEHFVTTKITYNKGGEWSRIKAPNKDSNGNEYKCGSNCFLNLFGNAQKEIPPFYSTDSSLGVIIGNGNVGEFLNNEKNGFFENEEIATFLSTDGGLSFKELFKGIHTYEIGDKGGIIIVAKYGVKTNQIKLSFNEGNTFTDYKFTNNHEIIIENILIEERSSKKLVFILGYYLNSKKKIHYSTLIDLGYLDIRLCQYTESILGISDYTNWEFGTSKDSKIVLKNNKQVCLLGENAIYKIKKNDSICFNPLNFIHHKEKKVKLCKCDDNDYECDNGYIRNEENKCQKLNPNDKKEQQELTKELDNCVGYYQLSQGYKKINGSKCIGGLNYDPILVPCTNKILFSYVGIWLFIILSIILVILLYLAFNNNFINNPKEYKNIIVKSSKERKSTKYDEEGESISSIYDSFSIKNRNSDNN